MKKRLLWTLQPEQSLDQLISSYLLSQIKHMQQRKRSKSQGGKETTKSKKSPPRPLTQSSCDFFNTDI